MTVSVVLISPRLSIACTQEGLATSDPPHTAAETKYADAVRFRAKLPQWAGTGNSNMG
jgi:hypothetical protein